MVADIVFGPVRQVAHEEPKVLNLLLQEIRKWRPPAAVIGAGDETAAEFRQDVFIFGFECSGLTVPVALPDDRI